MDHPTSTSARCKRLRHLLAWAAILAASGHAHAKESHISRAKRATALIEVQSASREGTGSGFCIHRSGFFVTNAHVVKDVPSGQSVRLVLNPNEDDQATVDATVVRVDTTVDLAVLKAKGGRVYPTLEIGTATDLVETAQVTAFGYPFGKKLAVRQGAYPSISVNVGRVTSLRKNRGELEQIQLDASLNPGNSGGPVIDTKGKVVGVVVSGVVGAGVNFAIPVDRLTKLLERPDIAFTYPSISHADRHETISFTVKVTALRIGTAPTKPYSVSLSLTDHTGNVRTANATTTDGETYVARAVPVTKPAQSARTVGAALTFAGGSIECRVPDTRVTVGKTMVSLSDISELELADQVTARLRDGRSLTGKLTGLLFLKADLGGYSLPIDTAKAKSIVFTPPPEPNSDVAYVVKVADGSRLIQSLSGSLAIGPNASPPVAVRTPAGPTLPGSPGTPAPPKPQIGTDQSLTLPAPCDDVLVGGGGRYLLCHIKSLRKVAVFDADVAKIVGYLSLSGDNALLAAGATRLIVIYPNQKILQRWSLATRKKEVTRTVPVSGVVKSITMGSAANRFLVHWAVGTSALDRAQFSFFDVASLRQIPTNSFSPRRGTSYRDQVHIRASPDGRLYGMWCSAVSPTGLVAWVVNGNKVESHYDHTSVGAVLPDASGTILLTGTGALYSSRLTRLSQIGGRGSTALVPSHHPAYYITVPVRSRYSSSRQSPPSAPTLFTRASSTPLVALPELPEMTAAGSTSTSNRYTNFTVEKRFHLYPRRNVLVTIPYSNDRLVVRPFSVEGMLAKRGIDFLFVTTTPPGTIAPNQLLDYQIQVSSKSGGVSYHLESGPTGMTVSPTGRVRWRARSSGSGDGRESVIITVKDKSGQELLHSFQIEVTGLKAPGRTSTRPPTSRTPTASRPTTNRTASSRPTSRLDPRPEAHGLTVRIQGKGRLRSAVPDPTMSTVPPGIRVLRGAVGRTLARGSQTYATIRVTNRGPKTISNLTLACRSDIPGCRPQTQRIRPLSSIGTLRPGAGFQFDIYFAELPSSPSSGAARIGFTVESITAR